MQRTTSITHNAEADAFRARLSGAFHAILQWQQLDVLWERIKSGQWFFYQVGEALPARPLTGDALRGSWSPYGANGTDVAQMSQ